MKIRILFLVLISLQTNLYAQLYKGKVSDNKGHAIPHSKVWLSPTTASTECNENGEFEINFNTKEVNKIIATHPGFVNDTVIVGSQKFFQFRLYPVKNLEEALIKSKKQDLYISEINPIKTEVISSAELIKSACCDLAGCFETQGTISPQVTNVITNSKELRILGLSGVYNQVLIDGFPVFVGLPFTYGINSIPGTLIENIYVSKGANSVLQGFESISGQINVITKNPSNTDKLLANYYVNSFKEQQLNFNYDIKANEFSNLLSLNKVWPASRIDGDKDNFLDLPLINRSNIFNKFSYKNEKENGFSSALTFRFTDEERIGGQVFFDKKNLGSRDIYGQSIDYNQPEILSKSNYRFDEKNILSLAASAQWHNQNSFFGSTNYIASQNNLWVNLQHEYLYSTTSNLKYGVSFRKLNIEEQINFLDTFLHRLYNGKYEKKEEIIGSYIENTLSIIDNKLTILTGVRGDLHNELGFIATPRIMVKYTAPYEIIIRANAGLGWKSINFFSENVALLSGSRDIIFENNPKKEDALNYGFSVTKNFEFEHFSGYINADYYKTLFGNQMYIDYDNDPTKVIIRNLVNNSVSNGFQSDLSLKFNFNCDLKFSYNYLDVYQTVNSVKQSMPFNNKHRLLGTLSLKFLEEKLRTDINIHTFGIQRLPNTSTLPAEFRRNDYSKAYTIFNVQISYFIKNFEIYAGCENIGNFRQIQPILSWQNPFGPYFDTSSVWGPTRGREIYFGIRFRIKK